MNEQGDDYYYRLGRYQGVIELISDVPKSRPFGISNEYLRDWQQGYDEAREMYFWRRDPIKENLSQSM